MLVNAKLSYILVDGFYYSSGGLVIFTVSLQHCYTFLTDHLATETKQDRMRLPLLQ
jgi:hypothetical protein